MRNVLVVVMFCLAPLIMASDCEQERVAGLDNGFLLTDTGEEGWPGVLPALIGSDETIDAGLVCDAIDWWNTQLGVEALLYVEESGDADAVISVGLVPSDSFDVDGEGNPVGLATVRWSDDGQAVSADITVSYDEAYSESFVVKVMEHELGHYPFALDDDPGPPITVDLGSVMASPLDPLGELTAGDAERLAQYIQSLPWY